MSEYNIQLKDNTFIANMWNIIKPQLEDAFANSSYNNNYNIIAVWGSLARQVFMERDDKLKHIIAFRENTEQILGAVFSVFEETISEENDACSAGWFFTSPDLAMKERTQVAIDLMQFFHEEARQRGFKRVVTEIGTEAGEKFLTKRFGYSPYVPEHDHSGLKYWQCDLRL